MSAKHENVSSSLTVISSSHGYIMVRDPEHELAMKNGYVYLHRLVAAEIYGTERVRQNHVHHIDGDRTNNHPDNLEVLSPEDHGSCHAPEAEMGVCETCGEEFQVSKTRAGRFCSWQCVKHPEKIDWPEGSVVKNMVDDMGYSATGRLLGVSDNAVRKYLRRTLRG